MAVKNSTGTFAGFPIGFNRGNPIPLDKTSIWETLAEAQEYAKNGAVAYVGQVLAVNEGDEAKAYIIADEAGTLKEVGAVNEITEADVLAALGFDDASAGAQLVKGTDGKVSWIVPSTETVEGLQTTVQTLKTNVEKLNGSSETEGSVAYQIAQIVGNADENYDTLVEIADWIKSDSTGAAKMANDISALTEKVGDSSVADQISAALKDGENDKYALASDLTTLEGLMGETSVEDQINDALKVNTAEEGENPVYVDKYALTSHTHTISEVTGLQNALNGKADTSVTDALAERLTTLETPAENKTVLDSITQDKVDAWDAAEANKIESILVDNVALAINNDKSVSLPILSDTAFGLAKVDNTSIEANDGVIGVKAVHISKLYMNEDDELILNGGNA